MIVAPSAISLEFAVTPGHYSIRASHMDFVDTELIVQVRDQHMTVTMSMAPDMNLAAPNMDRNVPVLPVRNMRPMDLDQFPIERAGAHASNCYEAARDQHFIDIVMNFRITVPQSAVISSGTPIERLIGMIQTRHVRIDGTDRDPFLDMVVMEAMRQAHEEWDGTMPDPETRSTRGRARQPGQRTELAALERALSELSRTTGLSSEDMRQFAEGLQRAGVSADDFTSASEVENLPTAQTRPTGVRRIEL